MITLGDIFRRYGPAYRARHGGHLSSDHLQVMHALEQCRTAALGGHVYRCPACQTTRYSYHSCRNRHCPTCQQAATQDWLAQQRDLLLPVPYFLVTFTLPAPLRALARQHPHAIYTRLFHASAAALQQLAQDPRFLGGQVGMLGVLQTWTRDLRYHPHVHYLVPALGLAPDGETWIVGRQAFLVHSKPLAILFRAKFRAALRQLDLDHAVPPTVWTEPWVVDCRPVGRGETALRYLAPYIFRVALSNNRIERVADDQITFRYTDAQSGRTKRSTLPVDTFISRFLAHVLPKGFVKVRYYGLLRVGNRELLARARAALTSVAAPVPVAEPVPEARVQPRHAPVGCCPQCGHVMEVVERLTPCSRAPPQVIAA